MMAFLFYPLMIIGLMIIQTSLCNTILLSYNFFDLMTPLVIYIGLFRPFTEGAAVVVCMGLVMDAVTGCPFGLYLTIFFWLYIGTKWGGQYFHAGSILLLPFIMGISVLFENALIIYAMAVSKGGGKIPSEILARSIFIQTMWAMCIGPFFLLFYSFLQTKLKEWQAEGWMNRQ